MDKILRNTDSVNSESEYDNTVTTAAEPMVLSKTSKVSSKTSKSKTAEKRLFSVHRFLISEAKIIGLNLSLHHSSKKCIISNVHPDSIAVNHGIKEGDEILPSHDNEDVYNRIMGEHTQRPLFFEVKRLCEGRLIARSSGAPAPHSLHRFIITTSDPLGVMFEKVDSMILLRNIAPMSVANIHGLQNDDILCIPNTDGKLEQNASQFVNAVKGPMTIEVLRATSPTSATFSVLPKISPTSGKENVSNGVSKGKTTTEADNDVSKSDKMANILIDLDGVKYPAGDMERIVNILSNEKGWLEDYHFDIWMKHLEKKIKEHNNEVENSFWRP